MNIISSVQATTGLTGTIGIRVLNLAGLGVLLPRTTTGIVEDAPQVYIWEGDVSDATAWIEVWDTGGGSPLYGYSATGRVPTVQTRSGLAASMRLEIINPRDNTVWRAASTGDISEVVAGSGVYAYQGAAIPFDPVVAVWDDGNNIAQQEISGSRGTSPVTPPAVIPPASVAIISYRNVGGRRVPQEVKRLRREVMDFCRKLGQSVVLKHQWNNEDVRAGVAKKCPACFDSEYGQTRNDCPVCFAVGFVSVEDDLITNLYIEEGRLVDQVHQVNEVRAPKYGGYGAGYITWMVEPDTPVDIFTINEQGVMVQTQSAQGVAPWFPALHDNDLAINVELTNNLTIEQVNVFGDPDRNIAYERYQLKLTNPITLRGFGIRARQQNFQVQQTFEMAHIPLDNILYQVPLDR